MNRNQLVVDVSLIHIMEKQDGFVDANRGLNYISPGADCWQQWTLQW